MGQNEQKYGELKEECDALKVEVESLEKQNVELEKRKNKVIDEDDTDYEDEEETVDNEQKEDETEEVQTSKRPKGFFRKYPKEIRKLMREIDGMHKKSMNGAYGTSNIGKFGALNRAYKWKVHEVCHWLNGQGFVNYIHSFYENEIDGEILVNDLTASILHEDLAVKRFHTGKILREIQTLRQGGNYTQSFDVTDVAYTAQFSASERIQALSEENESAQKQLQELISEKDRLALQVDEYEDKISNIKDTMVPIQEQAEKQEERKQFVLELEAMKKSNPDSFGNVIKVRQWSVDEVCWYFSSIGLENYIDGLRESMINGEILIEDSSPEMLSKDIRVKRIHINQIMRSVEDLKHRAFGYEEDGNVNDIDYVPTIYATQKNKNYEAEIEKLQNEIEQMAQDYNALNEKYDSLSSNHENLNNEKQELLANIDNLKQSIIDLKNQQELDLEDAAKSKIEGLEEEINNLQQTIDDNLSTYNEEKLQKQNETKEIIDGKDSNIDELNTKIDALEQQISDSNKDKKILLAQYNADKKELREQYRTQQNELLSLQKNELYKKQKENDAMKLKLDKKVKELKKLKAKNNELSMAVTEPPSSSGYCYSFFSTKK